MAVTFDTFAFPVMRAVMHPVSGPVLLLLAGLAIWPLLMPLYLLVLLAAASVPVVLAALRQPTPVINWWDEVVLVTGGSHGVGLSLVNKLIQKKPKKIVVLDLKKYDYGSDIVTFYECDVSKSETVKQIAQSIISEVGHPTMIVNNAGIVVAKTLIELSDSQIEKVIGVNLLGPMWVTKAFLPGLLKMNRGHIVNVASLLSFVGSSMLTDYCASKAGLMGFHDSLRQELQSTNIRVSAVNPGLIESGMFAGVTYKYPFLTPPLSTCEVSGAILAILNDNRSASIKLPWFSIISPIFRAVPVEFSDYLQDMMGSNKSISSFKGHSNH